MKYLSTLLVLVIAFLFSSCGPSYDGIVTRPYTIRGQHYEPMSVEEGIYYDQVGTASWYDESSFFGLKRGNTSLGEKVYPWHMNAAHKTLPLPSVVKVTNLDNGKSVKLRVNDRGPFIDGRIIDVSPRAAGRLGFKEDGLTTTRVEVLSVGDGKYKQKAPRKKRFFFF